jgi:hypothetical protein
MMRVVADELVAILFLIRPTVLQFIRESVYEGSLLPDHNLS